MSERDDARLEARCPECGEGFTEEQWLGRHSYGLEDVHRKCCRVCKRLSA